MWISAPAGKGAVRKETASLWNCHEDKQAEKTLCRKEKRTVEHMIKPLLLYASPVAGAALQTQEESAMKDFFYIFICLFYKLHLAINFRNA